MLEIAEFMASLKEKEAQTFQRDIVFAGWSGEELGLHGSRHFTETRVKLKEAKNEKKKESPSPHDFTITISDDGKLAVNAEPTTLGDIEENFAFMGKSSPAFPIMIQTGGDTKVEHLTPVTELATKHGLTNVKTKLIDESDIPQTKDHLNVIAALNLSLIHI